MGAIAGVRVGKYNLGTRACKCKASAMVGNYTLWARTGKYKLGATAGKYKLGTMTAKYKLGTRARARVRTRAGNHKLNVLYNVYSKKYIIIRMDVVFLKKQSFLDSVLLCIKKLIAKNTVISPSFLVWKFCVKVQFPHSFGRLARNSAETVPLHKISTPGH